MAEVGINTQNKDASLLIPQVREQTQKQMQPSGGLNGNFPPRHSNSAQCPLLLTSKLPVQVLATKGHSTFVQEKKLAMG